MTKRKKIILAVIIIPIVLLLIYGGYRVIDHFVMWHKLSSNPVFYTFTEEEKEYFSERSKLPLKEIGNISRFVYGCSWREKNDAFLYISVPNEKKAAFLQEVVKNYPERPDNYPDFINDKAEKEKVVRTYGVEYSHNVVYEFEEDDNETIFVVYLVVGDDALHRLAWNKIKAGDQWDFLEDLMSRPPA